MGKHEAGPGRPAFALADYVDKVPGFSSPYQEASMLEEFLDDIQADYLLERLGQLSRRMRAFVRSLSPAKIRVGLAIALVSVLLGASLVITQASAGAEEQNRAPQPISQWSSVGASYAGGVSYG